MTQTTSNQASYQRWTSADLELLPDSEWKRYEIVAGELLMTRAPHLGHQDAIGRIYARLLFWSEETQLGQPFLAPGVVFSDVDDVIPEVVWIKQERLAAIVDEAGHLTAAPGLAVEVLSPGWQNERRARELKLRLYSLKGVLEYWIVNWQLREIEAYRRESGQLQLIGTLRSEDY
ncbi:MAG: Uma2 family endonuclease [Elainella sp. C42_A2020_010]|nr:Uma2 family endonuclease [Elainella sp. C42_A2020_010]